LRRLIADTHGYPYEAVESLEAARAFADGYVILQGDFGGQIYLVCPASQVGCPEAQLRSLLSDLDKLAWREPEGARLLFERHPVGEPIVGGMGGGEATGQLWLHKDFEKLRLRPAILAVLSGVLERLK
jgi:hypothetical protein